ncbi:tRNA(fMet)-specific endonuclease VapC [Larkinella ripae]
MKRAIIDTDTLSYFFRNHPSVVAKIDSYLREHGYLHLSVVTYYEVLNGLYYKDARKQLDRFLEFARVNSVLPLSQESAQCAAEIFAELRKQGQIIGHNDILIAGTAIVNDLSLVTNNVNHFDRVPGLSVDNWSE